MKLRILLTQISKSMLLILFLLVLLACSEMEKKDEPAAKIPVTIYNIEETDIKIPILTSGKISSQKEIKLSFKTGGIIDKIFVNEGQLVSKGDLLTTLDLKEINSQVVQAKVGFDKAKRDFSRIESLYADSVVTLEQYQNVKTALELAEANLNIAEFNQGYSVIRAPNSGQIYKKFAESNEMVAPGSPVLLFGSTNSKWKITSGLTDKDIQKIRIGDMAEVSIDALPDEKISAVVSEITGTINTYSSTYEVELLIESGQKNIVSGMIAAVKIIPKSKGYYKTVPIKSIVNADKFTGEVFTLSPDDSTVNRVDVKLDGIWNENVIIKEGLKGIDNVILDGVEYVYDGAKVKVVSLVNVREEEN